MNYTEFSRRVNHNTDILKDTISKGDPVITILPKIYTWNTDPGELKSSVLLQKGHDMLPASYLGLLANTDRVGADAFKVLGNNHRIAYELKTSEVNSDLVWMGWNGGLYLGTPGATTKVALTSSLCATYSLHTEEIIDSKNLSTILMISDSKVDGYIDAYELDGDTIISYINRTENRKRTIKLGTFRKNGWNADTVVELTGFMEWKRSIMHKATLKRY